jgi:hypothetical protein
MTAIYILVVQEPPREKDGCLSCQFEDGEYRCTVSEGRYIGSKAKEQIPEWCPLQRVELEGK